MKMSIGRKNLHNNIPYVPLDNVSFHYEESVSKWKFIYNRRLAPQNKTLCRCSKVKWDHGTLLWCSTIQDCDWYITLLPQSCEGIYCKSSNWLKMLIILEGSYSWWLLWILSCYHQWFLWSWKTIWYWPSSLPKEDFSRDH